MYGYCKCGHLGVFHNLLSGDSVEYCDSCECSEYAEDPMEIVVVTPKNIKEIAERTDVPYSELERLLHEEWVKNSLFTMLVPTKRAT